MLIPKAPRRRARQRFLGGMAGVLLGLVAGVTRADETSFGESLSADGRFVVFTSSATDLVPGQVGGRRR